ncbi:hypothetical protein [Kribbella sp. DT2]|uniref:hypothetical protein n=1 Tax=Kribbella sp. DT2 TaxID=3393427 RepID=UPI003CE6B2F9
MRTYLLDASNWLVGLVSGLAYGVLFGLAVRFLMDESWTAALVAGAAPAPAFGLAMGLVNRRTKRLFGPFEGDTLDRKQRGRALRAAQWGPIPDDPEVRAVAARFARRQLAQAEPRWVRVTLVVGVVFLLASSVLGLIDDDIEWRRVILPLCGVAVCGVALLQPRFLRRRIAHLESDQAP